ncbi:hypothetical protein [Candidatus Uabimicrobium amorphum]|uniref:Lipoprotein SmpA/OmlA domain-containing protein n=1 Tax=Uabimicrobium amorphum TaxID=2596890 RepID=A0A5S9IJR8_UABAM|nr:hypothetical protein [Candidatus Uabimicrobium amorphum]BBM82994.1 hypothetical protein UABAM_01337 [Candidatus Uabimicrobium amorphum]
MKKAIILLISATVMLAAGCSQKTPEVKPNVDEKIVYPGTDAPNSEYDEYLLLMEDSQRARFFKLNTDLQKQRFLQAEGIIRKKELNDTLSTSMSTNEVAQALGFPNDKETNMYEGIKEVRWTYVEFNNYRNMKYTLTFRDDALDAWYLWLD